MLVPENCVLFLVGAEPKTQSSQRCREGRIYYLQQLRRTQDLSQTSASLNSKIGEILS